MAEIYHPGEVKVDPFRRYITGAHGSVLLRINHKAQADMLQAVRARQSDEVEVRYA